MGKYNKSIKLAENYFSNKTRRNLSRKTKRSQRRPNFLAPSFRQQLTRKLFTHKRLPVYGQSVYKPVERQTVRRPALKSRRTRKSKNIYKIFNERCNRVAKFVDILVENRQSVIYNNLVTYIHEINTDLVENIREFKKMYGKNNNNNKNNNTNTDQIAKLVELSEDFKDLAYEINNELENNEGYLAILSSMSKFIKRKNKELKRALCTFKRNPKQSKNDAAMNEKGGNNDDELAGLIDKLVI